MTTGTPTSQTGKFIDFERLRRDRLRRMLEAMDRHGLEALILSRAPNVSYAGGALALWLPGRSRFSPVAIVLRDTQAVHLMRLWDYGVPPSIPGDRLFPIAFNPARTMESVQRILGPRGRLRIGVDHLSPLFADLLRGTLPEASLVDGAIAMTEARMVKTEEEIACIKMSIAISEAAIAETVSLLRPGVTERDLLGAFQRRASELGATRCIVQGGFCVQPTEPWEAPTWAAAHPPMRRAASYRQVKPGELVTLSGGVFYADYESDIGRTWLCGPVDGPTPAQQSLYRRWREDCLAMAEECRPGRTGADLLRACGRVAHLPLMPVAHGSGLGLEPPVIGARPAARLDAEHPLEPGMVLVLQPYVWEQGTGGFWAKETLLITEGSHEVLTRLPAGPCAKEGISIRM